MNRTATILAGIALAVIPATAYAASLEPSGRNLKPCANEGSRGPCVWDAVHMGNGEGQSFVVLPPTSQQPDGRVVNVSHREAHELLNWS